MAAHHTVTLVTLITYLAVLAGIGLYGRRRTHDLTDFHLGGRAMGSWLTALSANASSSSAWTLLGVSGAAFSSGGAAIWILPGVWGGMLFNWLWLAPRLRRRAGDALTLIGFVCGTGPGAAARNRRVAALIVLFCFVFYIASQFQGAATAFEHAFGLDWRVAMAVGAAVVLAYTFLGGFWSVSATDALQGLLMAAVAIILPLAALSAAGLEGLTATLRESGAWGGRGAMAALGWVVGLASIGLGYPGQPHVLNRFMAVRSEGALRGAQYIALAWAAVIYSGMLVLGWSARVLVGDAGGEEVLFVVADLTLGPLLGAIVVAAVLSAIMSTADSQLLVAAGAVSEDWLGGRGVATSRLVLVLVCLAALAIAAFLPAAIFSRVLFAWGALGAAFAPVVLARVTGYEPAPGRVLGCLLTGALGTVLVRLAPDTPADWAEKLLPWLGAALVLYWPLRRRD